MVGQLFRIAIQSTTGCTAEPDIAVWQCRDGDTLPGLRDLSRYSRSSCFGLVRVQHQASVR